MEDALQAHLASSPTKPTVALAWASEIDEGTSIDQFRSSVYTGEGLVVDVETLDTKVAAGLTKIMHGDFTKRVTMNDEGHHIIRKKMLNGRQIACLMFQHFRINAMENSMLELSDLMAWSLRVTTCEGLTPSGTQMFLA